MSFDLTQKIKIVNPHANNDELYGPYDSIENALIGVNYVLRVQGRTVGIIENGIISEYWFKEGIEDEDLIKKISDSTISDEDCKSIVHSFTLSEIGATSWEDDIPQLLSEHILTLDITIKPLEKHYFEVVKKKLQSS